MSLILIHESVDESVAPVGDSLKASFRYLIERLPPPTQVRTALKENPSFHFKTPSDPEKASEDQRFHF